VSPGCSSRLVSSGSALRRVLAAERGTRLRTRSSFIGAADAYQGRTCRSDCAYRRLTSMVVPLRRRAVAPPRESGVSSRR
jgi:hypothetical protein